MPERLRSDLIYAVRSLVATPVTTFATVLLLAVATGANLAVFGLIDRAILTPARHVVRPDRLFTLAFAVPGDAGRGVGMTSTSYVAFDTIRSHAPAMARVAAWRRTSTTVIVSGEQTRAEVMLVSGSYFSVLGAVPQFGRAIEPADDQVSSSTAIISHAFWRSAFGGDPGVLGRRVNVNRIEYVVSGVMPAGFSGHSATRVDVWVPFAAAMRDMPGWNLEAFRNFVSIIARVEPGEDVAATAQASTALERRVSLVGLGGPDGGEVAPTERRIAYALAAVSILVLIIGLANAATLLLVRGTRRRREAAIRSALGATRGRLFARVLLEAAMLASMATAGALALSSWIGEAVRRLLLAGAIENEGITLRTLLAALLAGLAAFALAAFVGLLQLPRHIRSGDLSGAGYGARRSRAYPMLLLVQTTLSVVLIAGAGMFGRSLYNLMAQDFGMRLSDVVLVGFEPGPRPVAEQAEIFRAALERIRSMPGVESATVVQSMPFTGFHVPPIGVPGMAESPSVNGQLPFLIAATPEFLDILGIDILQGRRFTADDERGAPVVIVNQTMARTVWPGENALGKCIRIGFDPSFDPFTAAGPPGPPTTVPCREVIGVARDVRQRSVVPNGAEDRLMQYFVPFSQVPGPPAGVGPGPGIQGLLIRTAVGAESLISPIRRAVVDGRTDLPFVEVRPYTDLLARQMRPWRLGTALLSLFGILALSVAGIGLYAVFAHAIAERRREMAIRIAIGAPPARVLGMILREACRLAAAGALCGCALAVLAGRWLQSMLVGTAPSDPIVLGAAAILMLTVAALASFLPARAASRSDPTALLRAE
jgi:putative ABC transport system permease protein